MMFGLKWRCDGSEGIKWYVRAIRAHGSFYGEVRFQSAEQNRRIATSVSGQLSPTECGRMAELGACLAGKPAPVEPGPHFAALFERLSPTDGGDVRLLLLYHQGDETHSDPARAFVELAALIERQLAPFYAKLAEHGVALGRGGAM